MRAVVAGLGNPYRLDDAVGLVVAAEAARRADGLVDAGPIEDPLDLLGRWDGADLAVVVDATRSGRAPGTVAVVDLTAAGEGTAGPTSTHGVGLVGAWRIARALGNAPARVVVVGVEGERFGAGEGLSARVAAAAPSAVEAVVALVAGGAPCA